MDRGRDRKFEKRAILVENLVEIFGRSQLYDFERVSESPIKSKKKAYQIKKFI